MWNTIKKTYWAATCYKILPQEPITIFTAAVFLLAKKKQQALS